MCWSTRSPTSWENVSLTCLKWSTSTNTAPRSPSSSSIHSVRARRLPSPVSGSIRAARLSSSLVCAQLADQGALAQLAGPGAGLVHGVLVQATAPASATTRAPGAGRARRPRPRRARPGDRAPQVAAGALGGPDDALGSACGPGPGGRGHRDPADGQVGEVVLGVVRLQVLVGDRQQHAARPVVLAQAREHEGLVDVGAQQRRTRRRARPRRRRGCAGPGTGTRGSARSPRRASRPGRGWPPSAPRSATSRWRCRCR